MCLQEPPKKYRVSCGNESGVTLRQMVPTGPLRGLATQAREQHQQRRRVRVLVHRAWFLGDPVERYHVKVTNTSPRREVEITHVWFETQPRVDLLNPETPLPHRLRLDETFETWIPVASVPNVSDVERRVRVLLSNGKVVKSRLNKHVPPIGAVAGPGRR